MFDSRTDKARGHCMTNRRLREPGKGDTIEWGTPRSRQAATRQAGLEAIQEGIAAYLDESMPAKPLPRDCEVEFISPREMDRLHMQALREDAERMERIEEEAWAWLAAEDERAEQERWEAEEHERQRQQDEAMGYGWMPVMRLAEAREHFGIDFVGNGFHVTNRP